MIRREFKSSDGQLKWLLISQVEHARISGLLAAEWRAADLSPYECDNVALPTSTIDEILGAITHHDDGWTTWEQSPAIDPSHRRPYSFLNELPIDESLKIWDGSIAAARQIGPLAGWMVAGHFSELLAKGNHAAEPNAAQWLRTLSKFRTAWLRDWQEQSELHSHRIADRALRLLQACDFLSLWLCCDCPARDDQVIDAVKPFRLEWPAEKIGPYYFTASRAANGQNWHLSGNPWPFSSSNLEIAAEAQVAPLRPYNSREELTTSLHSLLLKWVVSR